MCGDLSNGGTTPSYGTIKLVMTKVTIPVFVMIRPRAGDFCYSDEEFEVMLADIEICAQLKVGGVVFGILKEDGSVDKERCAKLVKCAKNYGLSVTFHRAFDHTSNPLQALEDLISLSIDRVLTSGQHTSCPEGLETLIQISQQANGRIIMMPGGGLTEANVKNILNATQAFEIHTSCRSERTSKMLYKNTRCHLGGTLHQDDFTIKTTDGVRVKGFINLLNS
uniref:Copper homeostasis protein cutC homolog n=1 Tax=Arcella intermedia TaxID=1963864 RepID=A0A6B2LFJ5_9EUKA